MYRILLFFAFALAVVFFAHKTPNVVVFENPAPEISTIIAEPTPTIAPAEEIRSPLGDRISKNEPVETQGEIAPTHQQIIASPTPTPAPLPRIRESILYERGLEATVNLVCSEGNGKFAVATGAIIHNAGYILTNAHVADGVSGTTTCTVNRGSPARKFGEARLVFLPKAYGQSKTETERAHHDISIWKLKNTGTVTQIWEIDFENAPKIGESFLTQSYPAEFLADDFFSEDLNLLFSSTETTNADNYLLEAKFSLASQRGSSGGILIDRFTGKVRGIIFGIDNTKTRQINERKLYALTPLAANETIQNETGKTLMEYLAGNP